jgi:hypothetical protein
MTFDAALLSGDSAAESVERARTSYSAVELLATTFPEPRWAVPGILAEGLTFLAGAPKLGKSWLALNVSLAIASGGRALGQIPVGAVTRCTSPWRTPHAA